MKDVLREARRLVKKYGAAGALSLLARCVLRAAEARLGPGRRERAEIAALTAELAGGDYERVVLRRGSFGWHAPLFQRAQQLARAMGRRGCLVLYEAAPPHDRLRGVKKLGEGLWLVNLRCASLRRRLERAAVRGGRPRYLMLASPESRFPLARAKSYAAAGWTVLYDYIDAVCPEISGGGTVPHRTRELYEWATSQPDTVVTASALALRRDAEARGHEAILVENGVDCAHFLSPAPCPEDETFRALLRRGKPIVCYYGALACWLDYEALRRIAADGRFTLLLIGVRYDDSCERELAGRENAVFLGPRPYETLSGYAARCDVLLVPFRPGALADAVSPVKLFEYLALGVPVVAGDSAECRRCGGVLLAAGAEDYIRCIEQALEQRGDERRRAAARREALRADWLRRAETLSAALRERERGETTP